MVAILNNRFFISKREICSLFKEKEQIRLQFRFVPSLKRVQLRVETKNTSGMIDIVCWYIISQLTEDQERILLVILAQFIFGFLAAG